MADTKEDDAAAVPLQHHDFEDNKNFHQGLSNVAGEGCGSKVARAIATFFAVIVAIIPLSWLFCIKVVREYERAVLFRLGKAQHEAKGPGIFFLLPFIDSFNKVDLRTITLDVPSQEMITKDSVTVKVNAVVYISVSDPIKAALQVANYKLATSLFSQTTLRSVVGESELDELLSRRERINEKLTSIIDEATDPWGVSVTGVEIKDVHLPANMQRAMASQAEAERERRAKIISAEGEFQSAEKLAAAADMMSGGAMQLRYMQTIMNISVDHNETDEDKIDEIKAEREKKLKLVGKWWKQMFSMMDQMKE
eukprot:737601_1